MKIEIPRLHFVSPSDVIKWTEADLLRQILELAKLTGWRCHHQRPGLTRKGKWGSAIQGDVGFPDLVLVHPGTVSQPPCIVFAELKGPRGKPTLEQQKWLYPLMQLYGGRESDIKAFIWRPDDWEQVVAVLTRCDAQQEKGL